jgi:hypothetical protein
MGRMKKGYWLNQQVFTQMNQPEMKRIITTLQNLRNLWEDNLRLLSILFDLTEVFPCCFFYPGSQKQG